MEKLQALIGVLLRASLTGFVVDDDHAASGARSTLSIRPVSLGAGDLHVEPFFRVQNLRRGRRTGSSEKLFQVFQSLFQVQVALIIVLNSGRGQHRHK